MSKRILTLGVLIVSFGMTGCLSEVEAACNTRCEQEQKDGCRAASDDCGSVCYTFRVASDDVYNQASKANCGATYESYERCLVVPSRDPIPAETRVVRNSLA